MLVLKIHHPNIKLSCKVGNQLQKPWIIHHDWIQKVVLEGIRDFKSNQLRVQGQEIIRKIFQLFKPLISPTFTKIELQLILWLFLHLQTLNPLEKHLTYLLPQAILIIEFNFKITMEAGEPNQSWPQRQLPVSKVLILASMMRESLLIRMLLAKEKRKRSITRSIKSSYAPTWPTWIS